MGELTSPQASSSPYKLGMRASAIKNSYSMNGDNYAIEAQLIEPISDWKFKWGGGAGRQT